MRLVSFNQPDKTARTNSRDLQDHRGIVFEIKSGSRGWRKRASCRALRDREPYASIGRSDSHEEEIGMRPVTSVLAVASVGAMLAGCSSSPFSSEKSASKRVQ